MILLSISIIVICCLYLLLSYGNVPENVRPNVVIFLIDALRADRLSVYGYPKSTCPNMEQLAQEGVVFQSTYACAPWTLPSIVSLMTSRFPSDHGVVADSQRLKKGDQVLAKQMKTLDYQTAAFFQNPYAGQISGLHQGYDKVEMISRKFQDFEKITRWIENQKSMPFYLYIHIVNPHGPWRTTKNALAKFGSISRQDKKNIQRSI